MNKKQLQDVLESHRLWLAGGDGECADLYGTDLNGADLYGADLRRANFRGANLSGANLGCANLYGADLSYASLSCVNFSYAVLHDVNLSGATICGANFCGADLRGAKISDVKYNENTAFFALQCPEEGSFIGWKKCRSNVLVKLLIPEDAKRSSATSRKCRASKAIVLEVIGAEKGFSTNDGKFVYEVGKEVFSDSFDEDRWNACSHGIHFFITRKEAENY
jgi:uncharacterized protein YjbI with pentapeptide repeats